MAEIPIKVRGEVVALALVDDADAERLSRFRWLLHQKGFAWRAVRMGRGRRQALYLHREVVGATHGDGQEIRHANRNKLDNRRANLRTVLSKPPLPHPPAVRPWSPGE